MSENTVVTTDETSRLDAAKNFYEKHKGAIKIAAITVAAHAALTAVNYIIASEYDHEEWLAEEAEMNSSDADED